FERRMLEFIGQRFDERAGRCLQIDLTGGENFVHFDERNLNSGAFSGNEVKGIPHPFTQGLPDFTRFIGTERATVPINVPTFRHSLSVFRLLQPSRDGTSSRLVYRWGSFKNSVIPVTLPKRARAAANQPKVASLPNPL